ncbi:hypothetical protein [Colwellia echini]|uniref:Uncharacterized protein n=1 Tax=Colwellia echini TaxID=1982103 RepID=A0ABY3MX24_9GAMM|nr:hypothetical protein [Colwellia echini]TYK65711.1 hypothetical protein CWS31_008635 [Colwellia echini]
MNKHLKIAFLVAPILAIAGFGLADLYSENEAAQVKLIQLVAEGNCDVSQNDCVLSSGEFQINVSDQGGVTEINSTFPLDTATLFLVDENDKMTAYPLGMKKSPYYWRNNTPLGELVANQGDSYKLRLVAKIKGGQYISEFYTTTAN